jgi:hypothetical protein
MRVECWETGTAILPAFEQSWRACLAHAPHAHFGFDPRHLEWQARHGEPARAALIEEHGRRGALILRRAGSRRVCGWPWRLEAVVAGNSASAPGAAAGLEEAAWLFAPAQRLAGAARLIMYLARGNSAVDGPRHAAGGTLLRSLAVDPDRMLAEMDVNKRRAIKRAVREGYEVRQASSPEEFRAFANLQRETEARRGVRLPELPSAPEPGESWREWEHPWMWLLVAGRAGAIEAGSGYGFYEGATVDYRANASSLEAKKLGANALIALEALRRARERGFRWMNWGGLTEFKRELGGLPIAIDRHLGGGLLWAPLNYAEAWMISARPRVASWAKRRREPAAATPKPARG